MRQFLVAQGVPAERLKTISYGKERPEVVGSDEGSWARNRVGITAFSKDCLNSRSNAGRSRDRRFRLLSASSCLKMAAFEPKQWNPMKSFSSRFRFLAALLLPSLAAAQQPAYVEDRLNQLQQSITC